MAINFLLTCIFLNCPFQYFVTWNHNPHINNAKIIAAQNYSDDVFANVMDISFDCG